VHAFFDYGAWLRPEFERRARHWGALSPEHVALLGGESVLQARHNTALKCLEQNARVLRRAVATHATENDNAMSGGSGNANTVVVTSPERHMVKVRSTLRQIARDWSSAGKAERDSCYAPLISAIQAHLAPVTADNFGQQRVLVPGSGLGRLVFDLAVAGYDTQGNEFSYFMLLMGDHIMNRSAGIDCFHVHPWLGGANNVMSRDDEFEAISFPDVHPSKLVREAPGNVRMSVAAGEFLMCYDTPAGASTWDAIATCFFIDTAPNIIDYIEAIHRMLVPGGIWTSIGPLEYHWKTFRDGAKFQDDARYHESVELSFEDVRRVMLGVGFELLQEERRECVYASHPQCMKKTVFDTVFFVARKKI
jgi:carnosine N-methyltransferase